MKLAHTQLMQSRMICKRQSRLAALEAKDGMRGAIESRATVDVTAG
jgi:hypothetical protein